jgi:pimeloyl-ACP methyl ester carboxylesterase
MQGLGHFPMSENPKEFLQHLLPVLEKIGQMAPAIAG